MNAALETIFSFCQSEISTVQLVSWIDTNAVRFYRLWSWYQFREDSPWIAVMNLPQSDSYQPDSVCMNVFNKTRQIKESTRLIDMCLLVECRPCALREWWGNRWYFLGNQKPMIEAFSRTNLHPRPGGVHWVLIASRSLPVWGAEIGVLSIHTVLCPPHFA